jgi:DNA-binding transcriptional LysR family regulator
MMFIKAEEYTFFMNFMLKTDIRDEQIMDMNILKYMAFVKTVEYGSFTRAAEVLNYSQSGVSRMVSDLEKEWNVSLLERVRGGVHLTSEGIRLLPHAKNLCDEYQKLQMQVDDLNGLQSGLIRIGTFSSVATHWLPHIIKQFQKDYPNIDYELVPGEYSEIEQWIMEGRVDCGFILLPTHFDLETIFLERDPFMAILPADHKLADCERLPIASLCDDPFMLLEKDGKSEVKDIFRQRGLSPKVHFSIWDDYAIMSMVESGLGISVLPRLILRRAPYNIVIKELEEPAGRDIALALRDKDAASLAVKKFIDYLKFR